MPRPGFVSYAIVMRLLTMSIVWLSLLIWFLNAYRAGCVTALAVLALLGLVLLAAGMEKSLLRRRALFQECMAEQDRLFDLFHNRLVMTLYRATSALFLGLILLASALTFEPRQWSILFVDVLLMALLLPRLARSMGEQVHDEYRYALARQWGMWFSVALLWGEAIMVLTLSPPENYLGQRWQEVVTYGVSQSDVLCPQVADLTNVLAAAQALAMWAVQNASLVLNDPTQAVMVWVGFVSLFGLTFLVAWAFSQALIGVMARPWEVWSLSAMPAPMRNPALPAGRKSDAKQDHA
ncbi:MAG: hypothetical protein WBM40_22835 [Thiohalocapsa sp.]